VHPIANCIPLAVPNWTVLELLTFQCTLFPGLFTVRSARKVRYDSYTRADGKEFVVVDNGPSFVLVEAEVIGLFVFQW
jgi:hypothetical protein